MFTYHKLPPLQQQLKQQLQTAQNKGQYYLQMYQSQQTKHHAISILQFIDKQTLRQIKQQLHNKYSSTNHDDINRCKEYCYQYYYLKKDYMRKTSKRDCALFGIIAFSFVNLLCMYGLWKVGEYFLKNPQMNEGGNNVENTCGVIDQLLGKYQGTQTNMNNPWKQKFSKYGWGVINFILGSYASFGLWHSTALFIHCLDIYFHRRKQSIQLKNQIAQHIRRERLNQQR